MRVARGVVHFSAGDLAAHLACRHKTVLDEEVARGARAAPPAWPDPVLDILIERGRAHEVAYVASLGVDAADLVALARDDEPADAVAATSAAMRRGAALIVQPSLAAGRWFGRADVLRRVERPSTLGAWSYEVIDTKLATETRASTILQLCLYTELVAQLQGRAAEHFHVVTPPPTAGADFVTETFRVDDYAAYYRHVKGRLAAWTGGATYPDPVAHCDVCRWAQTCDARRHDDDSLWLVAGLSRAQYQGLRAAGVDTLAELATLRRLPLLDRGSPASLERVHLQARQQLAGRTEGRPVHALLPVEHGRGLARLPAPSPADLFFDLEGDRMSVAEGVEFLFGLAWLDDPRGGAGALTYRGWWATTVAAERVAFEEVMDFLAAHLERHPDAHVYHYAPYEPSALKRLVGRHGTRAATLDVILRGERLVDLCAVVRQALRASVERYSIKDLEPFYGYQRAADLRTAGACLRAVRIALACGDPAAIDAAVRAQVEAYNREDCESARGLRDWLEQLRAEAIVDGANLPRPPQRDGAAATQVDARNAATAELAARLLTGVPDEARTADEHGRWLLAQMLEYHRREESVHWWEHFRLAALSADEALDERAAIGGLTFVQTVGHSRRGLPIDRYRYPAQDHVIDDGDGLTCATPQDLEHPPARARSRGAGDDDEPERTTLSLGQVHAQSLATGTIDIQKREAAAAIHPAVVFTHELIGPEPKPSALRSLGERVHDQGFGRDRGHAAASALLVRSRPDVDLRPRNAESTVSRACRVARALDGGVLALQGPPGTGKTYTAARMICALVAADRRVGVTATSHKVLRHLLDEVARAAAAAGEDVRCMHKVGAEHEPVPGSPVVDVDDAKAVIRALRARTVDVVGGTPWLWAAPALTDGGLIDVLFVDEAGQMSLADTLAASLAARSLVLVGDPRQLEQPRKGSHPDGAEASALGHLFGDAATIPADAGIFLAETWRLAPAVNDFTSGQFYEGRLVTRAGNARLRLRGDTPFADDGGAGLWFLPVAHTGSQSASPEEVEAVVDACDQLLRPGVTWTDADNVSRPLRGEDVLVVAPYNAHVELLRAALAERGVRVGTVDKFQGQEAPVAIYTMATSSPEDAPRGMEFLYSANRLNVATSRARCATLLVASPRLFEPACSTPRQMKLANAFCRYLELARTR